jgi:chromate reductase
MKKILALCGSIKTNSANHQLLRYLQQSSAALFHLELFDGLTALPYFDPNPEMENMFEVVNNFRARINRADGVLICTPEYVFSLPGILKNALEWTVSTTVFTNKPTALITASSSGKVAHESLQLVMKTLGAETTAATSLLIPGIKSKMNAEGHVHHPETRECLNQLIQTFATKL